MLKRNGMLWTLCMAILEMVGGYYSHSRNRYEDS